MRGSVGCGGFWLFQKFVLRTAWRRLLLLCCFISLCQIQGIVYLDWPKSLFAREVIYLWNFLELEHPKARRSLTDRSFQFEPRLALLSVEQG